MLLDILFLLDICFFCHWLWLLPLLFFAWLLGWLLEWLKRQKYLDRIDGLEKDNKRHTARITELEKELSSTKYELEKANENYHSLRSENADLDIKLRACSETRTSLDAELLALKEAANSDVDTGGDANGIADMEDSLGIYDGASTEDDMPIVDVKDSLGIYEGASAEDDMPDPEPQAYGIAAAFETDNLQIIEGVGPKIEGHLKAGGYNTWEEVGNASIDDLQKVLDKAGPRYRVHNPKSWPEQARLASTGDWDALIKYQKFLDTGRDDTASTGETPSKVEKLYAKKIGFASVKLNDLKIIEGIGPKISGLLTDAGIKTWAELAACPVDRIQEVLNAAGDRYRLADPKTWPKQAALAANSKWAELKAYQDFLDGGKEK